MGIPTMILVTCLAAFLYFGGSFVFGVGSIMRVGYLGARGGALRAGSANAMRDLGGSEVGEGAASGLRGSGMVVARGFGGMMFARSVGAALVGGMTGFEGDSSTGCWMGEDADLDSFDAAAAVGGSNVASASVRGVFAASGTIGATGAGPGTGGITGCSGSAGGVEVDLLKAPAASTASRILLLVGAAGVAFCAILFCAGAAFGAFASFFVL
jgi:hypothetical protein